MDRKYAMTYILESVVFIDRLYIRHYILFINHDIDLKIVFHFLFNLIQHIICILRFFLLCFIYIGIMFITRTCCLSCTSLINVHHITFHKILHGTTSNLKKQNKWLPHPLVSVLVWRYCISYILQRTKLFEIYHPYSGNPISLNKLYIRGCYHKNRTTTNTKKPNIC